MEDKRKSEMEDKRKSEMEDKRKSEMESRMEIEDKTRVLLLNEDGKKKIVESGSGVKKIKHFGIVNLDDLVGKKFGEKIEIERRISWLLPPTIFDFIELTPRKTQIILPKDSGAICCNLGLRKGSTVVEGGTGSGSLTLALANSVFPDGKIVSYDKKTERFDQVKLSLKRIGLDSIVELKEGDVTDRIDERDFDSVVFDIPNPWDAVSNGWEALKPGGTICAYTPLVSQLEQFVKTLRNYPFASIYSFELIQRRMVVGKMGTRPAFRMLGHTAYLTFARKVMK
jgi:tRNA (adenine57-N1/adenine58-N1)-methyltransferase